MLRRAGPQRLGELAEHLRIVPRSATEVVDALAERGLVERKPDPADRRATLVALTSEGEEVATAIRAARKSGAGSLFASCPNPTAPSWRASWPPCGPPQNEGPRRTAPRPPADRIGRRQTASGTITCVALFSPFGSGVSECVAANSVDATCVRLG